MEVVGGEALAHFSTDGATVNSLAINGTFYAAQVASVHSCPLFKGQRQCTILVACLSYLTWLRRLLRNGLFLLRSSSTELRSIAFRLKPFGARWGLLGFALIGFPFFVPAKPIAFRIALERPCESPPLFVQFGHVSIFFLT